MDYDLVKPWLVLGGYALALALLFVAGKAQDRSLPGTAKAVYWVCGILASATTLFWLTLGTFSGPFMWVWAIFPVAIAALLWLRKHRQRDWMDRLAGRTRGALFDAGTPTRPSFGVLPSSGRPVPPDDPDGGFESAVQVNHQGHQLLGVQYTLGQRGTPNAGGASKSTVVQLVDTGNAYNMVQLQTPSVPTLLIRPRPGDERHTKYGPLEGGPIRPFDDSRLTRNTFGALVPDDLDDLELTDAEFTKYFHVRTSDPDFARSLLTPDVMQLLLTDAAFRLTETVLHQGVLWSTQFGQLSEETFFEESRRLAQLAATVPAEAWQDAQGDGESFIAKLRDADTGDAVWGTAAGRRRGPLASVKTPVNARRTAAGRPTLSTRSVLLRVLCVLVFAVPGFSLAGNVLLYAAGLAHDVQLTVTNVSEDGIGGDYRLNGEPGSVRDSTWLSAADRPARGDVVDVSIGPIPWQPMIEGTRAAVFLGVAGLALLGVGFLLVRVFFYPRRKKPSS